MLQMKGRDSTKMQRLELTRGKGRKQSPLGSPCYARLSVFARPPRKEEEGGMMSTCLTPKKERPISSLSVVPFYSTELCASVQFLYEAWYWDFKKILLCVYNLVAGLVYF